MFFMEQLSELHAQVSNGTFDKSVSNDGQAVDGFVELKGSRDGSRSSSSSSGSGSSRSSDSSTHQVALALYNHRNVSSSR